MFSRSFKRVGLHYTAFRNAIREDSRQTAPSRGVSPRKKFAVEANVESRAKLERLRVAKIAAERNEAEVQYCANGHGYINNEWDGVLKCPVCDSPFVGSCKIKLVESD